MTGSIIAHYLKIDWREPGVARHIEVSTDPIEIESATDGTMRAETTIFRDFYPWVGIRLTGELATAHPHLVNADASRLPWRRILDSNGQVWWVLDNEDPAGNRHQSEMRRSFGRFEVAIGQQRLVFENIALELDRAQAEDYLEDFRDDLAWLAVSERYGAKAEASTSHDRDLVEALSAFASAAQRVLDHPARDIHEITALALPARLRPNMATFREVSRNPGARRYPGRVAQDSADVPENRYLRYMVQFCERLSGRIARSAFRHGREFAERADLEKARSAELRATKMVDVDPEVFDNQLNNLKARIDAIAAWCGPPVLNDMDVKKYSFQVGKNYKSIQNCLFYKREYDILKEDDSTKFEYSVCQLPKDLFDLVVSARDIDSNLMLSLQGVVSAKRKKVLKPKPGKPENWRLSTFRHVVRATPRSPALEKKGRRREQYIRNGWRRNLTKSEPEEYRREARVIKLRAKRLAARAKLSSEAAAILSTVHDSLHRQDDGWNAMGVSPSSQFPMGMRYIQSPLYAGVLAAFRRVTELADHAGIGGDSFEKIEQINILHASKIYERWCLIKIISVLIEDFRFVPQVDWVDRVVSGVRGPTKGFALDFHRERPRISARLEFEPLLANGRRPDFRLRFQGRRSGIVMDAKFRTNWRRKPLEEMLDELVNTKDYGMEGDRVFILQPSRETMQRRTSPLVWGKDCDYGQDSPVNHARGAIRLAADDAAIVNLRRLIGLELQSGFSEPEFNSELDKCIHVNSFCIGCGAGYDPSDVEQRKTGSGNDFWYFSCPECGAKETHTHCKNRNCREPLYKNGIQLTYHLTIADQLTNVVCPNCGEFFDNDISRYESD